MPCHCARMFPFNQMKLFILSCLFTALACFDQSLNYRKQTDGKHQTNVKQDHELKWQKLNNSLAKEEKTMADFLCPQGQAMQSRRRSSARPLSSSS